MYCIICQSTMEHVTHEGVELDRCPAGHGIWVDRTELVQMVMKDSGHTSAEDRDREMEAAKSAGLRTVMDAIRDEGDRACPICNAKMQKLQYADYSAIVVDECPQHGTWLDGDELSRVEAYAEGFRARTRG